MQKNHHNQIRLSQRNPCKIKVFLGCPYYTAISIKYIPELRKFIQGKDYLNSSWTSQLHTAERLHVIYLAVAPKMQHHGLAEKLMDEVIDYADRHKLMISLETHNPANVSMYEKFGFKLYGIVQKKGFDLKQYCMIKQA